MDTIVERRKGKGLADTSHQRLARNSAALLGTYIFAWLLQSSKHYLIARLGHPFLDDVMYFGGYLLNAIRILFLGNIIESIYRLMRNEPDFSDLALTPVQRKLLGLNPNVASMVPTNGYVTPPRYHKSSAPSSRASSPGPNPAISTYNSNFHSPSPVRRSSFSHSEAPITPSPLRSTIRGGNLGNSLGFSIRSGVSSTNSALLNTPSPPSRGLDPGYGSIAVGSSGVPVGNRWVYEKMGRRGEGLAWTPGRNNIFSPIKGHVN